MDNTMWIGWAPETTLGTKAVPTQFVKVFPGSYVKHMARSEPVTYLDELFPADTFDLPDMAEAKIITPAAYAGYGKLLNNCFGVAAVDAGANPYTHTWTLPKTFDATNLKGLTVEGRYGFPDTNLESIVGLAMRATEFGWNYAVGEEPRFEATLVGASAATDNDTGSPTFPAYATVKSKPAHVTLTINSVSYKVRGFSLRVTPGMAADDAALGDASVLPADRMELGAIEFSLDLIDWAAALHTLYKNKTVTPIVITATKDANYAATWTLSSCQLIGDPPDMRFGQRLPWTANVRVLHNATDTALKFQEKNVTATT